MDAKEFIIKKFEQNNPVIIKLIEKWEKHSINENWDGLNIILNGYNVPNCPHENEYDMDKQVNKQFAFLNEICKKVTQYFLAKGYKKVSTSPCSTLKDYNGDFIHGYKVVANF